MGLTLDTAQAKSFIIGGVDTKTWTEEQRDELRALLDAEKRAEQEIEAVAVEAASPENVLADRRRESAQKAQDAADLRAFASAKKKHGEDMIGTIQTRDGLIIMRTATSDELDRRDARYAELVKGDETAADYVWWQETKGAIVYPTDERVEAMCCRFPRLKNQIEQMYAALVNGLRERALGK